MIIMRPEDGGLNYKPDIQQPHPDALFIDGVVWELNWNEQFEYGGYRYPQVAGKTRVQHLPVHIKRQYQQFFNIKK
jgi:hypothetical protein